MRAGSKRSAYLAYRSIGAILQALPGRVASPLGAASGAAMATLRSQRAVVRANLRRVLGPDCSERELDRAVFDAFESYARYWVESARLPAMRPGDVLTSLSVEGYGGIEEALAKRQGILLALPHLGSWEVAGYWFSLRGYSVTTVVEPVESPELFEWLRRQRARLGLTVLPLGQGTVGQLMETLREGGVVALVADRDISGTGVPAEFFGERTTLPGGPAVLALRSGAPLFPVAVYQRPGGRYQAVVRPSLALARGGRFRQDVAAATQQLAAEFELLIRAAPSQWHMFQPNWPSDR